jgi:hypothetical protein
MTNKKDKDGNIVYGSDGKPVKVQERNKKGQQVWRVCVSLGTESYTDKDGKLRKRQRKAQKRFAGTLAQARKFAQSMAEDYEAIFYIEIETGEYLTFSKSQKYMSIDQSSPGKNFFQEALDSIERCVYSDDWEYAKSFYDKETMLKNLEDRHSFSFKYRVLINDEPRHFLFTVMRENSGQYLIFYEKDIEDELNAEKTRKENQKKTVTFSQIAEALASNYDVIYYVDILDSSYVSFQSNNIYGQLEVKQSGENFFDESYVNIPQIVFPMDVNKVMEFLEKDRLTTVMENHKVHSLDYRLWVDNKPQYTRMTVQKSSDGTHFIIGVENINDEILRKKQFHMALKNEK